jgi:hypothetical protein
MLAFQHARGFAHRLDVQRARQMPRVPPLERAQHVAVPDPVAVALCARVEARVE